MNPEKIGKQIIKRILMEEEMTKVSIYPGAFKPPHKGHVEAVLRSMDDKTNKVIIFLSTKEREDVDVDEAKKVWDLYKANIPELERVEIQTISTPVKAVYDYAKDNPTHDIRAVFGKGEEERFKSLLDKEKYPHVEVFDAGVVGDFSATNLRRAIRDNDLETIKDYIPYQVNVDDFLNIFNLEEGLYPRYDYRKVKQVRYKASDVHTNDPDKLEEADPKKGTGKKPKGSGRRLYTDEDPTDTVKVKFSTRQDIVDTLNKTSFKNKSHARQSQVINLIHQRVRAALSRTKDPLKKARLKSAFEYIKKRKEASKKKTQRLKKQKTNEVIIDGILKEKLCKRGYNYIASRKRKGEKHNPFLTARAVKVCKGQMSGTDGKQKKDFRPKKGKKRSAQGAKPDIVKEIGVKLSNYDGQVLPGDVLRAPKGFPLGGKKLEKSLQLKVLKNSREGVNRYKLSLEDPKTGKKYTVRNFQMDGEYKGEKLPKWGMVRRSKENIKEIGDSTATPYPYKKVFSSRFETTYDFTTDKDTEYRLIIDTKVANLPEIVLTVYKEAEDEEGVKAGGFTSKAVTNKGELFRVMSTTFDIIDEWLNENPDITRFTYDPISKVNLPPDEESKRGKLYQKYIKQRFPNSKIIKDVGGGVVVNLKEGDTYEKMAAKGKKAGNLKQGTVRKRLGIPKDKKVPLSLINKELSRLKKMDKDPDKKGAQLGDKNQKYYKALQLAKTLKTTTNQNEDKYLQEARYKKFLNEAYDDSKARIIDRFMDYATDYLSIDRPKIKLINQDGYTQQHRSFGAYSPSDKKVMVVVYNRNMADILRTLAHELVHHMQNLDNRLNPKSGEDGSPEENEANSLAAVIMRKFGRENPDIYE
jgi:hypothetical protein